MTSFRAARGPLAALLLLSGLLGCSSLTPRNFRSMSAPAPIVRARAVGLGREQPDAMVVPALIGRLDDTDPVVRLSAHEELRRRSGKDFGYLPWSDRSERAPAIERWKQWWASRLPSRSAVPAQAGAGRRRKRF